MSLSIETLIKKWIDYDNQIKKENEILKELRDKRNDLNDEIINYSKRKKKLVNISIIN